MVTVVLISDAVLGVASIPMWMLVVGSISLLSFYLNVHCVLGRGVRVTYKNNTETNTD